MKKFFAISIICVVIVFNSLFSFAYITEKGQNEMYILKDQPKEIATDIIPHNFPYLKNVNSTVKTGKTRWNKRDYKESKIEEVKAPEGKYIDLHFLNAPEIQKESDYKWYIDCMDFTDNYEWKTNDENTLITLLGKHGSESKYHMEIEYETYRINDINGKRVRVPNNFKFYVSSTSGLNHNMSGWTSVNTKVRLVDVPSNYK